MTRTPYESAATPTSHNAADLAKRNVVCRSKLNLPNQTDSNDTLLPYLTHQLGSANEGSGVWNGTNLLEIQLVDPFDIMLDNARLYWLSFN